jgi:hypothetical protein
MVTGYGGTYLASVIDDRDPLEQRRLNVLVPEIWGDASLWAAASITDDSRQPAVGDSVWISFEHGDTDYPVWQRPEGGATHDEARNYVGKYRGRVIDIDDPMQERRLQVIVPEVDESAAWATAATEVADLDVPEIDREVWIEYEHGDPMYPRWVGLT